MKAFLRLDRPEKMTAVFGQDVEITFLLTANGEGEHIRITGDGGLIIEPSASNQVLIKLKKP